MNDIEDTPVSLAIHPHYIGSPEDTGLSLVSFFFFFFFLIIKNIHRHKRRVIPGDSFISKVRGSTMSGSYFNAGCTNQLIRDRLDGSFEAKLSPTTLKKM
jgi:hypothetical protein